MPHKPLVKARERLRRKSVKQLLNAIADEICDSRAGYETARPKTSGVGREIRVARVVSVRAPGSCVLYSEPTLRAFIRDVGPFSRVGRQGWEVGRLCCIEHRASRPRAQRLVLLHLDRIDAKDKQATSHRGSGRDLRELTRPWRPQIPDRPGFRDEMASASAGWSS